MENGAGKTENGDRAQSRTLLTALMRNTPSQLQK